MYAFLRLTRFKNLLFIILTQFLMKYGLLEPFNANLSFDILHFSLLVLATLCIAASGYVINDVYDVEADRINKPEKVIIGKSISEKAAMNFFIVLNIIGVGIGFYLSNLIEQPGFTAIFIFSSGLLYLYATYLKQIVLLGNILISLLVALTIIIVGLFELFPSITATNRELQSLMFSILLDYAFFAFLINLLREMVKDQEDVKGDYNTGMQSLPILLGVQRTNKIIFIFGLIPLAALIYYIYNYLFHNTIAVLYALFLIVAPLLYFLVKIWSAEKIKEFRNLSLLLKIILFLGIISIGLHQFIL